MKAMITIVFCALFNLACNELLRDHPRYHPPPDLGDGLEVGILEDVGIDSQLVLNAAHQISNGKYGEVHSLLIFKDNMLVFEEYFRGHDYRWEAPSHHGDQVSWDSHTPHYVHSVSKSITSMCVGIAVEKGFIESVDQSIFEYLPDYQYLRTEENKYVSIEHLLTGTSGLLWAEWNAALNSMENDQVAVWFHEKGPADFILSRPMIAVPGTHFVYSGGNIELLGLIVENASGMPFEDFSRAYLFEPLGLDSTHWQIIYPSGEVHAAAGLRSTPREMVKLGACMLNGGLWKGEEIIPEEWVLKSMHPYHGIEGINIPGEDLKHMGYSYTWWTRKINFKGREISWYSANGWGGQKIIVLPELGTVIVLTGASYAGKVKQYGIFEDYLLPALLP